MRYPKLNTNLIARRCGITTLCFEELPSTNTLLKEYAKQGAHEYTAVVAASQTAGRGRKDHVFFSPRGTGVYMSILLRPQRRDFSPAEVTAMAGVAACEAIEQVSDRKADIKWMNDVFCGGKKVCGILAESSFYGDEFFVVLGAGFNVIVPEGGFPGELSETADAIFSSKKIGFLREKLAISFYSRIKAFKKLPSGAIYDRYRDRLFIIGREVEVDGKRAKVDGIDRDYRLEVTYDDGNRDSLYSGEISLKL